MSRAAPGVPPKQKRDRAGGPPKWLGPAVLGASLLTAGVTAYLQMRVDEGARVDVWVTTEGGGLSIEGRF